MDGIFEIESLSAKTPEPHTMDMTEADNGAQGVRGGHGPAAFAVAPQAATATTRAEERDMDDDDDGSCP